MKPHVTFGYTRPDAPKPQASGAQQPTPIQQSAQAQRSASSAPMRRRLIERLSTGQGQREAVALRVILGPPVGEEPPWPYRR